MQFHQILTELRQADGAITVTNKTLTFTDGTSISLDNAPKKRFDIEVYEPSDTPGLLRHTHNRNFLEAQQAIIQFCAASGFDVEWVTNGRELSGKEMDAIPAFKQIICAAYPGSNEGNKIEAFAVTGATTHFTVATIKTFEPLLNTSLFAYQLGEFLNP